MSLTHPDPPAVALPPAFLAFHALHHPHYLAYADAHLESEDARAAVREAFGDVVTHWSAIVSHPNPTARAWEHFTRSIDARTRPLPLNTNRTLEYQAVVLHLVAGCSIPVTADTTGQHPSKIRHLLRTWNSRRTTHP
ncbi:hypothetical protein ACFZC6_41995 [Streptomyces ossamyceticus]|uniref:hypothetical protein n=1 Tax=Streptomyces ossamyceticus TaxID=249581 RepID=UPI0036ED5F5E